MTEKPDYSVSVSADNEVDALKKAHAMLTANGTGFDHITVHSREELDADIIEMTDADGRYMYVIEVVK